MIQPAPVDQSDLVAGYRRASTTKPVKVEDLNKVYAEYGLQAGQTKGKSDTQLQRRAAQAVVSWWQKQQAPKPAAPKPAAPAAKAPAVVAKPPAPKPIPAPQTNAGYVNASPRPPAAAPAAPIKTNAGYVNASPRPITGAQAAPALKAAGLQGTSPPAYALVSQETLNAWIAKVKYNRALLAKKTTVAVKAPVPVKRPVARHYLES